MTLDKDSTKGKIVGKLQRHLPAFSDVLDEEAFYIIAVLVVIAVIVGAIVLSRYVKISDAGQHLE